MNTVFALRNRMSSHGIVAILVLLAAGVPAVSSAQVWTQAVVSAAIHHAGRSAATTYSPPSAGRGTQAGINQASGARITSVHASRNYHGHLRVQTSVCWNGTERCVSMTGASLQTKAFNGLDAGMPIYLVHTVVGDGPLPAPLFIKGNVIVWYER